LDDYPRANPPSDNEMHIDLLCWMAMTARVLRDLSPVVNKDSTKYQQKYDNLLKELHSLLTVVDHLFIVNRYLLESRSRCLQ
jgi:mannosyl-oligosaccharide glucosidase